MKEFDIRRSPLVAGMSAEQADTLRDAFHRQSFLPGESVFSGTLRCDTLFVVVLNKTEHVLFDVIHTLPAICKGMGRHIAAHNAA